MGKIKKSWAKMPSKVRKPLILIIGMLFIIAAGLTGWLPGPGGIPLFLIGIAILATEFVWAKRIKIFILDIVHAVGHWYRRHRVIGTICFALLTLAGLALVYTTYRLWWS